MRPTILSIVALIFILGAGGYFLYRNSIQAPTYTPPASEPAGEGVTGNAKTDSDPFDITITYTDEGFSPKEVTVSQGTRIRFLNTSSEEVWPAVGVHPTHSLYPEKESTDCLGSSFDACKVLKKGDFFDFTFYYTGEWRYHDHIRAYNTGSVTVIESPATSTQSAQ